MKTKKKDSKKKKTGNRAVQFFIDDDQAAVLRRLTKVESLGPAARCLILKAIEQQAS